MSHFYGTITGNRGQATRGGSKASGLVAVAAGWKGAVEVHIYYDNYGHDRYRVIIKPWHCSGGLTRVIAEGVLDANKES